MWNLHRGLPISCDSVNRKGSNRLNNEVKSKYVNQSYGRFRKNRNIFGEEREEANNGRNDNSDN